MRPKGLMLKEATPMMNNKYQTHCLHVKISSMLPLKDGKKIKEEGTEMILQFLLRSWRYSKAANKYKRNYLSRTILIQDDLQQKRLFIQPISQS
mmetsp:Transcript_5655/g.12856  ORF Transcript_5655/g.12856 Transcript_5655/m.12856 type:complete len:94 (-) Transcript_5655:1892-2173(-)